MSELKANREALIEAAKEYEALYHADPHDNRFYPEMMVDFHLSQTNHVDTAAGERAELVRMSKAIDAIYNHNEAARAAVIQHYGLHHKPIVLEIIEQLEREDKTK